MKIRFYSDLHMEFGKFKLPDPTDPDTVLVLAGDIGVGLSAWPMIEKACTKFKAVIYVLGNHEFYNRAYYRLLDQWKSKQTDNFHFLHNEKVVIDDVTFFGSTLWTDFNKNSSDVKSLCQHYMNDYRMIYVTEGAGWRKTNPITPDFVYDLHQEARGWLLEQDMSGKSVVVTHHCPSKVFVDTYRYGDEEINYAYYSNMEDVVIKLNPDIWIAGHTHKFVNSTIGQTRVLSNPRGYVGHEVVPMFNPMWEVEI